MKKLLIKILRILPGISAVVGFVLVLGAVGSSDLGAPFSEILPTFLLGVVLLFGGAFVCRYTL